MEENLSRMRRSFHERKNGNFQESNDRIKTSGSVEILNDHLREAKSFILRWIVIFVEGF